jgi:hypothetical protein
MRFVLGRVVSPGLELEGQKGAFGGVLNTMNSLNGSSGAALSPQCLADGIPFTGPAGWYWWLRGVRRSVSDPNLCNR